MWREIYVNNSRKTEKDVLLDELAYLNSSKGFNPKRLFEVYKRLNKINICQNIYELTPKTMDPIKIKNHWEKSYDGLLALKPSKKTLNALYRINNVVLKAEEKQVVSDVYSYKNLVKEVIIAILKEDKNEERND